MQLLPKPLAGLLGELVFGSFTALKEAGSRAWQWMLVLVPVDIHLAKAFLQNQPPPCCLRSPVSVQPTSRDGCTGNLCSALAPLSMLLRF